MAAFTPLDPELHLKLIEGYQDELEPVTRKLEAFYRTIGSCRRCGHPLAKRYDQRTAFSSEDVVPHALLTCDNCGFTVDPFTNVVLSSGDASKIPDDKVYVSPES
jgi:hypothetical protein